MAKRAYQASGKSDDGGLQLLMSAGLAAGLAVGIIEGFVSQWFSLFIVFPALIGGAAGGAAATVIKARNVRMPGMAMVAGFVGGLLGQFAVLAMQYALTRGELGVEVSFFEWYSMASKIGVTINHHGSDITFSGIGYHIISAIEFGFAACVGGGVAWKAAKEPFCEKCNRWYAGSEVIHTASGEKKDVSQTISLLESGEMARAVRETPPANEKRAQIFHILRCTQCQTTDAVLTVQIATMSKKSTQTKMRWKSLITQDQLVALREAATVRTTA